MSAGKEAELTEATRRLKAFLPTVRNVLAEVTADSVAISGHAPTADDNEFARVYAKLAAALDVMTRYEAIVASDLQGEKLSLRKTILPLYEKQRRLALVLRELEGKEPQKVVALLTSKGLLAEVSELVAGIEPVLDRIQK